MSTVRHRSAMTQGHHHVLKHPALCYMHVNVATGDQRQCEALPESGESRELFAAASISMQFGSDPQPAGIKLTQPRQLVEFIRIARSDERNVGKECERTVNTRCS